VKNPAVAHFIPVGADLLGISPETAFSQITEFLPNSTSSHSSFLGSRASIPNFMNQLKQPGNAIGFIGHSVEDVNSNNVVYSVGLDFSLDSPNNLLVLPPSAPLDSFTHSLDAQYPVRSYSGGTLVKSPLNTDASVIFIGACHIGPPFKMLWNINDQTSGKVLIVPSVSGEVLLGHAVTAWARILGDLINKRMTVGDAVAETNSWLLQQTDVKGQKVTEQWQTVGDKNVILRH
jgi:hypothetical protein